MSQLSLFGVPESAGEKPASAKNARQTVDKKSTPLPAESPLAGIPAEDLTQQQDKEIRQAQQDEVPTNFPSSITINEDVQETASLADPINSAVAEPTLAESLTSTLPGVETDVDPGPEGDTLVGLPFETGASTSAAASGEVNKATFLTELSLFNEQASLAAPQGNEPIPVIVSTGINEAVPVTASTQIKAKVPSAAPAPRKASVKKPVIAAQPPVKEVVFDDGRISVKLKNPVLPATAASYTATDKKEPQKRGRKSFREIDAEVDLIEVPDDEELFKKQYYPISQVAKWFRVNTSLLRFWENEFDILKPKKNRKGDRLFRPEDVKNIHLIYQLLRERKFTVEGAKEYLRTNKKKADTQLQLTQTLLKFKSFLLELKAGL